MDVHRLSGTKDSCLSNFCVEFFGLTFIADIKYLPHSKNITSLKLRLKEVYVRAFAVQKSAKVTTTFHLKRLSNKFTGPEKFISLRIATFATVSWRYCG